jgi:hypothetical protein
MVLESMLYPIEEIIEGDTPFQARIFNKARNLSTSF